MPKFSTVAVAALLAMHSVSESILWLDSIDPFLGHEERFLRFEEIIQW